MALTTAHDADAPGRGGSRPAYTYAPLTFWSGTIAFDTSYPTGGEALDFTSSGLDAFRELKGVFIAPTSGYVFEYDYTNKKVLAYWGDNNNASDGPLVEVADTTNLSAVTGVRVFAYGIK